MAETIVNAAVPNRGDRLRRRSYRLIRKPTIPLSTYTRNMRTSVIPVGIASYSLERFAPRVCDSISRRNVVSKLPLLGAGLVPNVRSYHLLLTSAAWAAVLLIK